LKTDRRIETAPVVKERSSTEGRVIGTTDVVQERIEAHGGIIVADRIVKERLTTQGCVITAARKAKEGSLALSRVEAGITPVGRRIDRLRAMGKCKCDENESDPQTENPKK